MDFARRQLLKYGWEEGKGLGKNNNGMSEALKPTLKFDKSGVGHDNSEQFTYNWWENVYNQAADNITVVKSSDGNVNVELNDDKSVNITTKKYSFKKSDKLEYEWFLKTSKLTESGGEVDHENKESLTTEDLEKNIKVSDMTDEELFAACGGRTAHKGARHGLKQNGKLSRIEEQEMLLLKKMKKEANSLQENSVVNEYEKYRKKKCKKKKSATDDEEKPCKKCKKRKHSQIENDEIEAEAAEKRTEYFIAKQEKRKRKKLEKLEKNKMSSLTNMLENVCVSNQQENKDDGFEEKKTGDEKSRKKHKKKKRKLNTEVANERDDGFEEYISEVSEKLMYYKELRKDLQEEKRKTDENRISKMAEEFERKL